MYGSDQFCLKWNQFQSTFSDQLKPLRDDEDFVDVTLVSDDEEQVSAHKVILSICSPFFKKVLKNKRHPHPLLYMKGVNMSALKLVINFIYHGEVNVPQEELEEFLAVAKNLKILGLTESLGNKDIPVEEKLLTENEHTSRNLDTGSWALDNSNEGLFPEDSFDLDSSAPLVPSKQEVEGDYDESGLDNYNVQEEEIMGKENGVWRCKQCGKTAKMKHHIRSHIETHIEGVSYSCNICAKSFRSRSSLQVHTSVKHRRDVLKNV